MKLTEDWSIISGPHKQDYQLYYEHSHYDETKDKWVTSKQSYFYPTFETAVNGFVRYTGIDLVDNESSKEVVDKMEDIKQTILKLNDPDMLSKEGDEDGG